ncbi:hypothetical protein NE237_003139 [Protea cynaroides]|uniref:Transcription repressor n=1 Tax=Protea cynaroides TaxID=273540 RepID=A0A9Q0KGI6_9MAGN|nr:hypothetical protein NE237_003139 [Protea cynaroides]
MSSSSKSNSKMKNIRNTIVVKIGCGCRRPKLADVFRPKPKAKTPFHHYRKPDFHGSTSTSSWDRSAGFSINDEDDTTTSFSPIHSEPEPETHHYVEKSSDSEKVNGFGRISESVAVVKDSDDPYLDFRQSMLQMIIEKQIYDRKELRDLLDCFLQLNSPYHHEIIVRAFSEIWNSFFTASTLDPSASSLVSPIPKLQRKSSEF